MCGIAEAGGVGVGALISVSCGLGYHCSRGEDSRSEKVPLIDGAFQSEAISSSVANCGDAVEQVGFRGFGGDAGDVSRVLGEEGEVGYLEHNVFVHGYDSGHECLAFDVDDLRVGVVGYIRILVNGYLFGDLDDDVIFDQDGHVLLTRVGSTIVNVGIEKQCQLAFDR